MNIELRAQSWLVNGKSFATLTEARDYLDHLENYQEAPARAPKPRLRDALCLLFAPRRVSSQFRLSAARKLP